MFVILLINVIMVTIISAGYIPPYYGRYSYGIGGHYGNNHHKHGIYDSYGYSKGRGNDHDYGYYGDKYGHRYGYNGYEDIGYGDRKYTADRSYYDRSSAQGYKDESYENGGKSESGFFINMILQRIAFKSSGLKAFLLNICFSLVLFHLPDSDGIKKFYYIAVGSGPDGEYTRGYYGTEALLGYEDAKRKSKYSIGSLGGGYRKGYYNGGNEYRDRYSFLNKKLAHHSKHGNYYEGSEYGNGNDGYRTSNDDSWKNSGYVLGYGAHGPY
ncbi:hypothetical protein DICVIV_02281 [Dictyocaulus viviparus]|uniref:Uncharacterized protein n=1 Tax=Dictyocaulus viviparus TaxID=29172 RepID=A0A0D8Y6C0_DICVI|nr:hypothetical protein DICVIV_02281 [Dictyocaulus viviparus]